jgi:hypothetical protein
MSGDHNKYHMKVEFPERFGRTIERNADYRIGLVVCAEAELKPEAKGAEAETRSAQALWCTS